MTLIVLLAALLMFFAIQRPERIMPSLLRMTAVALPAALITAYFTIPFVLYKAYLSASPYLARWKYDSYGASAILGWLLSGDLFDYGRLPVMTLILVIGIAWAVYRRSEPALLALGLFTTWLLLYFGRTTWGQMADLLPLHEGLLFHRFSAGVDLAAILLVGLGGEWIWRQCVRFPSRWSPAVAAGVIVLLMLPAMHERYGYYSTNTRLMRRIQRALAADPDAATIVAALKSLPPGRVYAGQRTDYGNNMRWDDLHFWDLFAFNNITAVSPPYQSLSLNSDLIWHFNFNNAAHYKLFNVRYVIAPSSMGLPTFYTPIKKTARYTLYATPGGGYAQFAQIPDGYWKTADSQLSLFDQNRAWMLSADPGASRFIRWSYLGSDPGPGANPWDMNGTLASEQVSPGRVDEIVQSAHAATLVFKMTYHPDWHVQIDLHDTPTFMVSPSFIGVTIPAGNHLVSAVYKSNWLKDVLLILSAAVLISLVSYGPAFSERVESLARASGSLTAGPEHPGEPGPELTATRHLLRRIMPREPGPEDPGALARLFSEAPESPTSRRLVAIALGTTIVVAAAIRLYHLGAPSLWVDEGVTCRIATMPRAAMWHIVFARESNRSLYYLFLRAWITLFGSSEAAFRAPSALASIATVPILYALGKRMFGTGAGIIAALLLALSPISVWWARDTTAYALEIMFVAAGLLFLFRALERPSLGNVAGWAVCDGLAVFMHSLGILAVPAQLLPLLMLDHREVPWRRLLTAAAVLTAAVAPLLWLIRRQNHGQLAWILPPSWSQLGETLLGIANLLYDNASGYAVAAAYGLGVALAIPAALRAWRRSPKSALPFALAGSGVLVPFAILVVASFVKPMLFPRFLIFSLPCLCLFVAGGLAALHSRALVGAALAALVVGSAWHNWYMETQYPRYDWRAPVRYIMANARPGDALAVRLWMNLPILDYYFGQLGMPPGVIEDVFPDWGPDLFIDGKVYPEDIDSYEFLAKRLLAQIDSTAARRRRLWFVMGGDQMGAFDRWAPLEVIKQHMTADYGSVDQHWVSGFTVVLCSNPRPPSRAVTNPARPAS